MRQGIRVVLSEKADDSDIDDKFISEYLNKTFDYQIHLPILEQKNMKRYAKQLLMEQNIEWASDPDINLDRVLGVLIHSSIKTPRQTKELLNAFASDWILAKKRDNEVGKKVLTKNPLTLAVFTVIRTNFPDFYKEIEIDPYLIYREEDIKQLGNNELLAYLSRVERYIPKDDPRPYIYFSNEKLNPATGKPAVERTKQFLINGQEEEFVKSMNELGNDDKGIVLSSLLSDIDDNAGIEVENCLKTLIHTEIDLSFVSESDIDRWDQLLRDNKDYLMKFSPSIVCKLLDQLSDNLSTWNGYGEGIDINEYYNDLVDLWISNPDYINKLGLSHLGDKLTKTFLEKNEGLKLAKRLFKIPNNNKFLNEIDWIELLNESLINEEELDFNLSTWLLEWESKTFNKITPLHVTDLLEKYDFRSSEQIEGIGDVWCSAYENNNNGELLALINLINHDDFSGFNEENYKKLNSILEQQHGENYNQLAEVVNEMLSNWWDNGNQDRAIDFISKLYNSPGVVEFCELHFHFGLAEEELQLFLEVLIKRGQILETSSHFIEKLRTEFINAGNSHVQSKSVSIIKKLMENSYWANKLKEVKEQFVPINDHGYWLNWNETVLTQKLDVFFLVWETNEDAQVWLFNCIEYMAKVAKGYINSGRSYNGQALRYLNIIVESMIQHYRETINWNDKVKLWVKIQHPNQPNFSLFSILETGVRGNILGFLGRQIKINNEEFNSLLVEYAELNVKACREAIFARWEAIGKEGRKEIAGLFSELNEEILNENIQLLNKHLKYNASINYLDEVINWNIEDSLKKQILNTIIKSSPQHELNKWIIESLDFMNKKGNNYWLGYCIDYSIDEGLISGDLSENVIETSLNLGDERAKYALKLLDASGMSKGQMRRYRAKIEQLSDKHEELVEKIRMKQGWKFRKKSITK